MRTSPESYMSKGLALLLVIILAMLLFSCRVASIQDFKVIKVKDSTFIAKGARGKAEFRKVKEDSVFINKIIHVSIGKN